MHKALLHYTWLNAWAQEGGRPLFHLVPKFHLAWHVAAQAEFLNPRLAWTFKCEDFVGRVSLIAHSVTFGCRRTAQSAKLAQKYRISLHRRFTRGEYED